MVAPRMRPSFTQPIRTDVPSFHGALRSALAAAAAPFRGQAFADVAILRVHEQVRHLWSPVLHLSVERGGDGGWCVRGRFSPSSSVWTAFLAAYLLLTCLGLAAAAWGSAQWILREPAWALLGVPAAIALAAFTYGAALIGQGLGAEEMYGMRRFVEDIADGEHGASAVAGAQGTRVAN